MMKQAFLLVLSFLLPSFAMAQRADFTPWYSPKLKSELPKAVSESSGLFFHNGKLWTHNDSGGKPILYALDTTTFEIVQEITLSHAKNKDWEDVCTDGESVFVGDIGNNRGKRNDLKIYTFPLSALPDEGNGTVEVDSICFRFGDQKEFNNKTHKHDFDCEAMFASDECLYLFSKGWKTGTTRLYRLPKTPGSHVAEVVNWFDSHGLITGADYDREHHILVVVGYINKVWIPFMYLIFDFEETGQHLSFRRIEMPQFQHGQTEGICFFDEGRCYVSAETTKAMTARVFEVDFRKWIEEATKQVKP